MPRTVRDSLNAANPNSLPIVSSLLPLGEAINLIPKSIRSAVTANAIVLPDNAKCVKILRCYGFGGTSGFKTPNADGDGSAPIATECGVSAAGNITFAAADAITAAHVIYLAVDGEIFTDTIDVAANLGTLPSSRRAVMILSASVVAGGALGAKTPVFAPATPVAGEIAIRGTSDAQVEFAAADAVTRATVTYLAVPGTGTARTGVNAALSTEVDCV